AAAASPGALARATSRRSRSRSCRSPRVQAHLDLMRPDSLDRAGHLDPAPVEFGPSGGAHRLRDVRGADRAEQAPGVARLDGQPDVQRGEPGRGLFGVVEATDVAGRTRPLDQFDLLLRAAGPAHGKAPRDQVVAAVATGHLYDVTGRAQPGDLLGEDQLHRRATHLPASPAGASHGRAGGAPSGAAEGWSSPLTVVDGECLIVRPPYRGVLV